MRRGLCALLLMSAVACGGTSPTPSSPTPAPAPAPSPTLTAVTVSGAAPVVGATAQFSASAKLSDGSTSVVTGHAAWDSSNTLVAIVSGGGMVTALGAGGAEITATYQGVSGTAHVTVAPIAQSVPGFAGIRYDNIQSAHTFIVGSPAPTQDQAGTYSSWPMPVLNGGSFTFRLSDFPAGILPSGGPSNIVSASEMLLVGVNVSPSTSPFQMEWHKAVGQDTVIYSYNSGSAFTWAYTFIGHFSWEISEPGAYYVIVTTSSGSARMDFAITGSTSTFTALRMTRPAGPAGQTGGSGQGIDRRP